jgi:hypothetical protein
VVLIIVVQELIFPHLDTYDINFHTSIECVIHYFSCAQVFQLGAHKRRSLSRFNVEELDDLPQSIVVIDDQSVLDV